MTRFAAILLCAFLLGAQSQAANARGPGDGENSPSAHDTSSTGTNPQSPDTTAAKPADIAPLTPANMHTIGGGYPILAKALGEQGKVILQFVVGVDGRVHDAKVIKSSGYPQLDNAALDAVTKNWRYRPAIKDGKPIAVKTKVAINYKLDDTSFKGAEASGFYVVRMKPDDYPAGAKSRREEGLVGLMISADARTGQTYVDVKRSSGYPDLDKAAVQKAITWHVHPATIDDNEASSMIPVIVIWSLGNSAKDSDD